MELYRTNRVTFIKEPHKYILDYSRELIGVTTLLKKHGLSADYGGISKDVLDHAADLGTQAHEAIEAYCNGEAVPMTPLIKSFAKLGLDIIATEYLVSDFDIAASSIDLVAKVDDNTVDIIDMKRTSTVHKESVSWQTSIYALWLEQMNPGVKVRNLYCLPIKKGNADDILKDTCGKLVELERKSEWEVKSLLQCEWLGIQYKAPEGTSPKNDILAVVVRDKYPALSASLRQMKELEGMIAEAKEGIKAMMEEYHMDKISYDGVEITLKKPYQASKFNTTAFKKDHPDLAEQYTTTAEVAGSITIKLK